MMIGSKWMTRGSVALLATSLVWSGCSSSKDNTQEDPQPVAETPTTTPAPVVAEPTPSADPLRAAIDAPTRAEADRARDPHRHPYETLQFFGVTPSSTVLELSPGRGWYTAILAPYLAESGELHVTSFPADTKNEYQLKNTTAYRQWLTSAPGGDRVKIIDVEPPDKLDYGLQDQVDVVLTFRSVHGWMKDGQASAVYAQVFKALKPGGVFGVVDHRGAEGMTREAMAKSGYVPESLVIAEIEAAGFKLAERSEINANPKDTKDHPDGVWSLPPSLRAGDTDRAKYEGIGESDRMTLKFIKPAAAAAAAN